MARAGWLRVVTLNTWKCDGAYRDRLGWMADGLAALAPQVVFLQEAFVCTEPGVEADTASMLADTLGHTSTMLRAREKARLFEGTWRDSASNLAILSSVGLEAVTHTRLAACPGDNDRWILQADLLWQGLTVRLCNTHFTHVRGEAGDAARLDHARALAKASAPPVAGISILGGDLNALWSSRALAPLRDLNDRLEPERDTVSGTLQGERPRAVSEAPIIDHLVVRSGRGAAGVMHRSTWAALNTPMGAGGAYPSDHAAVVVDLEVSGAGTSHSFVLATPGSA